MAIYEKKLYTIKGDIEKILEKKTERQIWILYFKLLFVWLLFLFTTVFVILLPFWILWKLN